MCDAFKRILFLTGNGKFRTNDGNNSVQRKGKSIMMNEVDEGYARRLVWKAVWFLSSLMVFHLLSSTLMTSLKIVWLFRGTII